MRPAVLPKSHSVLVEANGHSGCSGAAPPCGSDSPRPPVRSQDDRKRDPVRVCEKVSNGMSSCLRKPPEPRRPAAVSSMTAAAAAEVVQAMAVRIRPAR